MRNDRALASMFQVSFMKVGICLPKQAFDATHWDLRNQSIGKKLLYLDQIIIPEPELNAHEHEIHIFLIKGHNSRPKN